MAKQFKLDSKIPGQEPVVQQEKSFFQMQMDSIGIDASNIFFEVPKRVGLKPHPNGNFSEWEAMELDEAENETERNVLFHEDEQGNMVIPYYDLYGHLRTEHQGDNKWPKPFGRTRFKVPKVGQDGREMKYQTAWKAGNFIYFPPEIISKFRNREKIELLIVTEGEKKSVRGAKMGLDVVGIAGIHNFYTNNESKRLHEDLIWLMVRCQVQKVLFLTDADTLTVKFEPSKELSKRPNLFYSAWKNFREATMAEMAVRKDLALRDVYVGCISRTYAETAKGLDDLFSPSVPGRHAAALEGIRLLQLDNHQFNILNITDGLHKLQNFLGLINADNFYQVYSEDLGDNEFVFKKLSYRWLKENEKLIRIGHLEVKEFMRTGCDYFRLVNIPNKYGELEENIVKWNKGEITQDYGKYFLDDLPKYLTWCNVPNNSSSYQRVIHGCFNLYNPITHKPTPGPIDKTAGFIKHLFGGAGDIDNDVEGDPFTVALDYLTIMWQFPMEILPVPCLVSPEQGTGKSTFLKWLRDIYGGNATIIDNERFKQSFNSHYITKFVIGIDEGFLDVEKRAEKERLKKLATDDKQFLEFKGADVKEVDFYGKIIICGNDAESLMKMDEEDIRWFVIRVPTFKSKNMKENPDLRIQMKEEIPAWLHFLSNRKIFHPKIGRAWFDPKHIVTEQMKIIIENTRNRVERVVDGLIVEMFQTYKCWSFRMDLKAIQETIKMNGLSKYAIDELEIKKFLKDRKKMVPNPPGRIRYPDGFEEDGTVRWNKARTARFFQFKAEDWLKEIDESQFAEEGVAADLTEDGSKPAAGPASQLEIPKPPADGKLPF